VEEFISFNVHDGLEPVIGIIVAPAGYPHIRSHGIQALMIDPRFMDRALDLAARGGRTVMPNPMVGAVIVRGDTIIGEGYHQQYGGPHAEVFAIESVTDKSLLKDATIYVSLEPCSHFGKTPPCADLVIQSGIREVVVGCKDPNPKVAGRGIQKLRDAGITVYEGVRERECIVLNRRFILFQLQHRPYVILKWAETSDKFIAREDGTSQWISGEFSRRTAHRWRAQEMSILVGTTTARLDDPRLTVRHIEGVSPLRLVIDKDLSLSHSLAIFNNEVETWIFNAHSEKHDGNTWWKKMTPSPPLPNQILEHLYAAKKLSVMIEGGTRTLQSFIDAGLWDEARVFQSKKSFGTGLAAPSLNVHGHTTMPSGKDRIEIFQHPDLAQRLGISDSSLLRIEEDLLAPGV
jgi:diaminohydroxyphosphoribosylaminopyrimidine deaminase/5-amino-6-(5-phosphoribosylamino)uracil reductase